MKKRYLLLALAVLLSLLMLAACGEKDDNGECSHDFKKWKITQEGDCANPGIQSRECRDCGYTQTEEIRASMAHREEIIPGKDPTCTEPGTTEGKRCSVCQSVLEEQKVIDAVDHTYREEVEQAPDCNADGVNRFTCQHCGDSYTENVPMPSYTAVEIHDMAAASVGEVVTYDSGDNALGLGSCFVYDSDGVIVTNYHVIEGASFAVVYFGNKSYDVTKVLAYSPVYDLAVLQISVSGLTPLPVCPNTHAVGETVYAFGSSQGLTATFSQGIISYAARDVDGVLCVQHDAAISPGNSGGPLINRFGEVIGINTWYISDSQNLNFAVSVAELDKLDYSNPMTLDQVAKLECNAFGMMKEYILTFGDYFDEDYEYSVVMDAVVTDSGSRYITYYNYDLEYQEIELCITIDWDMYLYFYMDEDGVYGWEYWDVYGDYMYGYLDPGSVAEGGLLPYSDYELNDSSSAADLCAWASYLAEVLCGWLSEDMAILGLNLTASDFGFVNFES